jgi:hypothetical protein
MPRRKLRAALLLALLGVAVGALLVFGNRFFLVRVLTYPDNPVTDAAWYQPREPARGALALLLNCRLKRYSAE